MPRADGLVALGFGCRWAGTGWSLQKFSAERKLQLVSCVGSQDTTDLQNMSNGEKGTPSGGAASLEGQREGETQVYL